MRIRILVNWDYDRSDLMIPFIKLQDDFEFIFIYKYSSLNESTKLPFKVIYWNDYTTPYDLLKKIKPDKIIFHDIESFHQVALCLSAKNKKITTFHLEHGIKFDLKNHLDEINHLKANRNVENKSEAKTSNSLFTLFFYLAAFRLVNLPELFNWLKFIYIRKTKILLESLVACPFSFRKADFYINFTEYNARFMIERDKLNLSQHIFIGNPFYDPFLQSITETKNNSSTSKYFLFISTPFIEDESVLMEENTLLNFINKLNKYCLQNNSQLKIKLHPKSYSSPLITNDSNIVYLKDCDLAHEIKNAEGTFLAHFTTLAPLVFLYSKSVFFDAIPVFNETFIKNCPVPVIDFYNFDISEINLKELDQNTKQNIVNQYLLKTDGKSTERLKAVLIEKK